MQYHQFQHVLKQTTLQASSQGPQPMDIGALFNSWKGKGQGQHLKKLENVGQVTSVTLETFKTAQKAKAKARAVTKVASATLERKEAKEKESLTFSQTTFRTVTLRVEKGRQQQQPKPRRAGYVAKQVTLPKNAPRFKF